MLLLSGSTEESGPRGGRDLPTDRGPKSRASAGGFAARVTSAVRFATEAGRRSPRAFGYAHRRVDDAEQRVRAAMASGDHRLANELVSRYFAAIVLARVRRLVRGTVLEKDAEDLCHETLIKAFDKLNAGKLEVESSVLGYILGIARHTVFHAPDSWPLKLFGRAAGLDAVDKVAGAGVEGSPPIDPDSVDLDALLALLDERERVIVSLRLEDWGYDAIGRLLRIKANTANQIHLRALRKLKAQLTAPPAAPARSRADEGRAAARSPRRDG
jgi:DNA-directed RNA polymerase specialized sigma24 family protein